VLFVWDDMFVAHIQEIKVFGWKKEGMAPEKYFFFALSLEFIQLYLQTCFKIHSHKLFFFVFRIGSKPFSWE
jgi:hypothetical protein